MIKISERLIAVANMVDVCDTVADIGTDHGFVPIYLVKNHVCKHAIAMDVREGPLNRAKKYIHQEKLHMHIETRLSDGFSKLGEMEADEVVISGIGGELMVSILSQGERVAKTMKKLILSPQTEIYKVREYLAENGYEVEQEIMVEDDKKYYVIMKVFPGQTYKLSAVEAMFGKKLLEERSHVFLEYIENEKRKYIQIEKSLKQKQGEQAKQRIKEIEEILSILNRI